MGLKDQTLQLGSLAVENIERRLQNPGPQTFVDSAGRVSRAGFGSQTISRNEMAEIKEIRESGGIVAQLVHAKALMQFGTGAEFTAEREEVADWLHQEFNDLDNLLVDIGEDATWYPFSLAEIQETRGNLFDGITLVEPWTMEPEENDHGEIILWRQYLNGTEEAPTSPYEPDELAQFVLNKSSGRDNIGISEVKRAESEITQFRENHKAIGNAVEFASFMRRHVKVGREGAGVIPDRDLRRVRQLVENLQETTALITGKDVEFDTLDNADFPFDKITEHDLRKLALALGLPLELANVGSDGLGSGMPADLRLTLFTRQARAAQHSLADQFIQQIVRPVLRDYSPYNHEQDVNLVFGDPVSDPEDKANFVNTVRDDLTLNERREKLDLPPIDDEEAETPPALKEDDTPAGGGPGLFRDGLALQSVPDNARPISDPSECDGSVVEGPQGGMYCVPSGDGDGEAPSGGDDVTADPDDIESFDTESVREGDDIIVEDAQGNEGQVTVTDVKDDGTVVVEDSAGQTQEIQPDGSMPETDFEPTGMVDGDGDGGGVTANPDIDAVDPGETTSIDATVEIDGEEVDLDGDSVEVLDAAPDIGMLVEHPEHGRLDISADSITSIGDDADGGENEPEPPQVDASPSTDAGTDATQHEDFEATFSLENSVDQQSLADIGASQGKTAENMTVHEMDDGSTAFVKEFGEDAIDPMSRDQTLAGYEVMKQLAPEQVPSHAVVGDGDQLAVDGVEGNEVGDIPDDVDVDADAFARGAAAQVLMGNDDARPENVMVTDDGEPMFVDLDEAGNRFGEDFVQPEDDFRDAFRRAAKSMSGATSLDPDEAIDRMAEDAVDMAGEVDTETISDANESQGPVVEAYINAADEDTLMDAAEEAKRYLGVT